MVSRTLDFFGLPTLEWAVEPMHGLLLAGLLSVWLHLPFTFLILYSARLALPNDLYEAARIDGASAWQQCRSITLPLLVPAMLVAMLGICGPSTLLTLMVAHYIERFRAASWRIALQKALAPVAAGLILTSGILLVRSAGQSVHALVVSSAVVLISMRYNPNPLWFIAGGALVGLLFF